MAKPRVLLFDVETRYIVFRGWNTGEQYVGHDQIVEGQHSDIICLSYKWLGHPEITTLDWGLKKQDSAPMIEAFTKVVETADIAVGHNADRFDIRHINTQRMLHNQPPISWPTSEDTLKAIRRHFALPSYRLDYLSKLIGRKGKDRMSFPDWVDIVERKDPAAMAKMIRYNRNDVLELEAVYKRFARYLTPKANASLITNGTTTGCPRCGGRSYASRGIITLRSGRYQKRRCSACGTSYRDRKRVL